MKYTIAIELNGVVRNINKQILKYYKKDIDRSLDIDEINEKDDPFKYAKFDSKKDRNEFLYIDYPFEMFGAAKPMEENLPTKMNNFLNTLTNYEENDIDVILFSMNEEAISIQSSYFFLSKIGTRVRKVIFPKELDEINKEADIFITANEETFKGLSDDKFKILINTPLNKDIQDKADLVYDSLSEMLDDPDILSKLTYKEKK